MRYKGWYYYASVGSFGGFFWAEELPSHDEGLETWGPFETFGQAKRDAIAYFRTDVDAARLAIQEIRSCKKPIKK